MAEVNSGGVVVGLMAAGRGTRFGGGKLDARCAGKPVGQWVLEAVEAAGLDPGICVTGPRPPEFVARAAGWEQVVNPAPAEGMASSLAAAVRAAARRRCRAMLVVLADMPLVTAALLRRLASQAGAAATDHGNGRPGAPALLPAFLFDRLTAGEGDRGAAAILRALPDLVLVPPEPGALLDIDAPADLLLAEERLRGRGAMPQP